MGEAATLERAVRGVRDSSSARAATQLPPPRSRDGQRCIGVRSIRSKSMRR